MTVQKKNHQQRNGGSSMIYLVMQHVFTVLGTVDYYKMGRGCGNQRHWAGSIWIIPFNGEAKHLYKCTYQSPDPEALSTIKKKKNE